LIEHALSFVTAVQYYGIKVGPRG